MTESRCSCCQLFGPPPAPVNFIIVTSIPESLVYQRIRHLLRHYSEAGSSAADASETNYESLMSISDQLFNRANVTVPGESSSAEPTQTCCHGYSSLPATVNDPSNASELERFEKNVLDLLNPKKETNEEGQTVENEPSSWILLSGHLYSEPALLQVFLQLNVRHSPPLAFTFTVLNFPVTEQRLFEYWLPKNSTLQEYQQNTYPEYEKRIREFFHLLHSSKHLQDNTLLIEETDQLNDKTLEQILKRLFRNISPQHRAVDDRLRSTMSRLLRPQRRTVNDIRAVRGRLVRGYHSNIEAELGLLVSDLQQPGTSINAARAVVQLVLDKFDRMQDEESRAYKRQLILGSRATDPKNSNTVVAQLIHCALQLLQKDQDASIALLYSIVVVICVISSHFFFRHELFNNTPEIFKLSMLLICKRQYALTIGGLRLCSTILVADQNEHKYAAAYLTHDPLAARKILDAVKWLLSPYWRLITLWKEEEEEEEEKTTDSEPIKEKSAAYLAEKCCFRHTGTLLDRSHIRHIASLFHGSADHCAQVTVDDVEQIAKTIGVLADARMCSWSRSESRARLSLMLIGDLCSLLTPILLHSPPSITSALLNQIHLLQVIPRAIFILIRSGAFKIETLETCIRFYTRFAQAKYKQTDSSGESSDNDEDDEKGETERSPLNPSESSTSSVVSLSLTPDLISSYYNLNREFQKSIVLEKKLAQQEQLQTLFKTEWKKLDTLKLKHDYEQLKQEHQCTTEELEELRSELHRTQSERDQFRRENIALAQEIDRLKLVASTNTGPVQSAPVSNPVSTSETIEKQDDVIDQLQNLTPDQITTEQAERCIQEIYHRRTTFNDPDMRKSICGSLKHLGSDLYSSSVHFLHELIQNAEDNIYAQTIDPCLRIELNHDYILLSNNEQGLRVRDVLAICSLAVSTKSIEQQHIGEKGVGFKSVFAASNQPMLISHAWKFRFQVPGVDAMSYITPLWISDQDLPECISSQLSVNTHLYLPLKLPTRTPAADQFLDDVVKAIDPCILLNMRQLKKLEIVDRRQEKTVTMEKHFVGPTKLQTLPEVNFEGFTFLNLTGSVMQLNTSTGYSTFRVYTCRIDVPSSIEQRRNPTASLILAFPCEADSCLDGTVYAGLPVCSLGFNFMFNADFRLVTSRENVRENVPYNAYLRDHFAFLFVYLLLNDLDLKKDISRYCPSSNTDQVKHLSWWRIMIDRINELINRYLPELFGIQTGKLIRYGNPELMALISSDQLYNCAHIQLIDSSDGFFTAERLKSFQIQTVSIKDVLDCFPNQEETTDPTREEFCSWAHAQDQRWWSQFFHRVTEGMTSELSTLLLCKPIFMLQDNHKRQYLPKTSDADRLLFINDDQSLPIWKRQLTLLHYASQWERTALLHSNHVQLLVEERLIEIILHDHLQLALSPPTNVVTTDVIEELWQDLVYLQSRLGRFDRSAPLVVPIDGSTNFALIANVILPTIFGVNVQKFIASTTSPLVRLPYYTANDHRLTNHLQWEHFLLQMNCQRPAISLPEEYKIDQLPLLPSFTMFLDEKSARLGESVLAAQAPATQECLRHFPIHASAKTEEQISPVSTTFDETIAADLPSLPRVTLPSYCRALAIQLGVRAEYDLRTCSTILQLLSDEKNTNVDLYVEWLGRLQLNVRQQYATVNPESLLSSCQLYLPDQQQFCPLKDLLIVNDDNEHRRGITSVCKYLKLQLISPSTNQIYWQFKELFRLLRCHCEVTLSNIYLTIYSASHDKANFFALGDCQTTLSENGMEMVITLFQYLEHLILVCVKANRTSTDLYRVVVEKQDPLAPCGSAEDLRWRFALTLNDLSRELKTLTGLQRQRKPIPLLTIERQLIAKKSDTIIYACFETKIIQNLSRQVGKRYFISPAITRTCPLVLSVFGIDYVERRGRVEWIHKNLNLENHLSQLTEIFQRALGDARLEVVTSRYASANLFISDTTDIGPAIDPDNAEIDRYMMESDYPFWVFGKTVLFCTGDAKDNASRAVIATSALATLLHKRKQMPFDEAKSVARQRISQCTEFRSNLLSSVVSTEPILYSYLDLVFPKDHQSIESMIISIGRSCTVEHDPQAESAAIIAADRMGEDRIYRDRAQTQNHRQQNETVPKNWMDPTIVDGAEHIRIGQNAEHFFFTYLQQLYGTIDVTPTKNWRSSSRLVAYPQYSRNIDDSAGYDFELHDTQEKFVRGTGSITKRCFFEVKGTSGAFNRDHTHFHISRNELETCEGIANDARRREREAYLIVIIDNCLDSERIALAVTIDWSSRLNAVEKVIDSYQCKLLSLPSPHSDRTDGEVTQSANPSRQNRQNQQQPPPRFAENTHHAPPQPSHISYDDAATGWNPQQTSSFSGNDHNMMAQSAFANNEYSYPYYNNTASGWYQQQAPSFSAHLPGFVPQTFYAQDSYSQQYSNNQSPSSWNQQPQPLPSSNPRGAFQGRGRGRGRNSNRPPFNN